MYFTQKHVSISSLERFQGQCVVNELIACYSPCGTVRV